MKKLFLLILISGSILSCNDGDLIVTNFSFEDTNLSLCGKDVKVLYNINNQDINEAIALVITPADDSLFKKPFEEPVKIQLNDQNQVFYRTFEGEVGADYFCNEIPAVNPKVLKEYKSTTGGTVIIASQLNNANDHDGDGVPSSEEGQNTELDTDGDEIPDYLDIDDDGDNIKTNEELEVESETNAGNFPDSDADGIPNYLDPDDDGDGVKTRLEDWNRDGNPTNDLNEEGLPYYLDPEATSDFEVEETLTNTFSQTYRYVIRIENLTLKNQGGNGEEIRIKSYNLGFFNSPSIQITLPEKENPGEEETP